MKTSLLRLRLVPTVGSAVQVSLAQSDTLSLVSNRSLCHCDAFAPLPNPKLIFHALSPSAPSVPCFATHDQGRERAPQAGIKAVINPATSPLGNSRRRRQNTQPRRHPSHTSTTVLEHQKKEEEKANLNLEPVLGAQVGSPGTYSTCSHQHDVTQHGAAVPTDPSSHPDRPHRPSTRPGGTFSGNKRRMVPGVQKTRPRGHRHMHNHRHGFCTCPSCNMLIYGMPWLRRRCKSYT